MDWWFVMKYYDGHNEMYGGLFGLCYSEPRQWISISILCLGLYGLLLLNLHVLLLLLEDLDQHQHQNSVKWACGYIWYFEICGNIESDQDLTLAGWWRRRSTHDMQDLTVGLAYWKSYVAMTNILREFGLCYSEPEHLQHSWNVTTSKRWPLP